MSSVSHPDKIEFAILLIITCHYILWSSPFKIVNSNVKFSYINHLFDFPGKNANLRLPLLNIFGGCAMLGLCTLCCCFVYVVCI